MITIVDDRLNIIDFMTIQKFEDIIAWQRAQDLAEIIYIKFGKSRDYGFRDQICRAVVSISNNIAEGFERRGDNEFRRFLKIALGSCSEVRSMIYLASRLNYLEKVEAVQLLEKCIEVNKLIYGLLRSL